MTVAFIASTDPRWQECLAEMPHDFYHLPEYVAFAARQEGGEAVAFWARDGAAALLVPLLLRPLPEGLGDPEWRDAASPYGYPSPLVTPATSPPQLESFLSAFAACSREERIVSAFLRFHPLLPLPLPPFAAHGTVVHHGSTVCIDLSAAPTELWRDTRENHRRGIVALEREGFTVRLDHWEDLPDFVAAYAATMDRVEAERFYHFPASYFAGLRSALGERLHLCAVLSPTGEVAAAGLFTAVNGLVQYHLGGTADPYLRQAPSKLMFHHVRSWARGAGYRLFHLGGGLGGRDDTLFRFKSGFSSRTAPFHTGRLILHRERYAALSRQRAATGGVHPDFFPLYRG